MATDATCESAPDAYALWSLLIPFLQRDPGRGYLVDGRTAVPNGLPTLHTNPPQPPVSVASDPQKWYTSFQCSVA